MADHVHYLWNDPNEPERVDMFFEYNPSLTKLPPSTLKRLVFDDENDKYHPVYLLSVRVSSLHSCIHVPGMNATQWQRFRRQNFLGLALLQADLSIIPNTDVVIDIESQLDVGLPSYKGLNYVDYRLYTFGNDIYLNINGPPVNLVQLIVSSSSPPSRRTCPTCPST